MGIKMVLVESIATELPASPAKEPAPATQNQKIRLAYVTSPRELYSEKVGIDPAIMPTLAFLQQQIKNGDRRVSNIEIAAVVVDDNGREIIDGQGKRQYLSQPTQTFEYLRNFCEQQGIAFHVEESAGWRKISRNLHPAEKHRAKVEYEQRLLAFMRQNNIDVILSDSYAVLFNSTALDRESGFRGLIINIHPGIASEVPGAFPTRDSIARGLDFFTDNAAERGRIRGRVALGAREITISRNGHDAPIRNILAKMGVQFEFTQTHVRMQVAPNIFRATTGATLHEVDEMVDHGPAINCSTGTPIRKGDSEHALRQRNYETKNNVVLNGLPMFLKRQRTQELIAENRIKNRAFNGDSLPTNGALQTAARAPNAARARATI